MGIALEFEGTLSYLVTEDDGTVNRIQIPEELVKEMLNDWNTKFFKRAMALDRPDKKPKKKKRKTTR